MEASILLVDDKELWRRSVRSLLQAHQHLHVVGEAADGLEAVQKSQELHPDLILLDIGIPTLNGIKAADRIGQVAPDVKILFVSQNNDLDIVHAVLSHGACGYVLKTDAGRELLPGIAAVLDGETFVSSGLKE